MLFFRKKKHGVKINLKNKEIEITKRVSILNMKKLIDEQFKGSGSPSPVKFVATGVGSFDLDLDDGWIFSEKSLHLINHKDKKRYKLVHTATNKKISYHFSANTKE